VAVTLNADLETELTADSNRPLHLYELEPAGPDAVDVITDGGFESWASATDLDDWTEVTTGGTVNREAAVHRAGTYCARLDKSAATQVSIYTTNAAQWNMTPAKYYRVTGWVKCSTATPGGASFLRVYRTTGTDQYLQADGTWAVGTYSHPLPVSTEWVWFSMWFLVDAAFAASDDFKMRLGNVGDASASFYFDDWKIKGPYDNPGLYYSSQSQALTWNGQTYTELAVKAAPVTEDIGPRAPEARVTFSNIDHTLRARLLPTDLLTGNRFIVRLITRDSSNNPMPGSLIEHKGVIQQPRRIDQDTFEITSYGLIHGLPGVCPPRRLERPCGWTFADGAECAYTSTTTATNNGTGSTALVVASGVDLVDGQTISVGDGNSVISSGGGTVNITLATPRTWIITDPVAYTDCTREGPACDKRNQEYRYGGFRGIEDNKGWAALRIDALIAFSTGGGYSTLLGYMDKAGIDPLDRWNWQRRLTGSYNALPQNESLEERTRVVPVVYGRRLVSGSMIERLNLHYTELNATIIQVAIYVLSEGEISGVVDYYGDENRGEEVTANLGSGTRKMTGYFYRVGGIGVNTSEVEADYLNDTTQLRDQNRDYFSGTQDALSRTAYATFVEQVTTLGADNPYAVTVPSWDVKGVVVWRYTNDVTPTHLPGDGPAKVFTRNPIWQVVDLLTHTRYGLGGVVEEDDIDFTVTEPEADVCDVEVSGLPATVTSTSDDADSGQFTVWTVDDTSQFSRGMTVEHDDGTPVQGTVTNVWDSTRLRLSIDDVAAASPDTLTPILPRYTNDLTLGSSASFSSQVYRILASCGGYVTYADGKIQLRVERSSSSVAHFRDTGYAQGYGIIQDSFILVGTSNEDNNINSVVAKYNHPNNTKSEAVAYDWDHRKDNLLNTVVLDIPGVNTRNQAQRLAERKLAESRTLGPGAEFMVGPIGAKIQPGDLVTVTHPVADWTAAVKRVKRVERYGLGGGDEFLHKLVVVDYDATLYNDDTPPPLTSFRPGSANPDITLAVNSKVGKIILTWTLSEPVADTTQYKVFKSTSSMSGAPGANGELVATGLLRPHFTYVTSDSEIGTTLYFQVVAFHGGYYNQHRHKSNEISAAVIATDPTADQHTPGVNTLYDGNFEDANLWIVNPPSPTQYLPDTSHATAGMDGNYTTPDNAWDADADPPTTSAFATINTPGHKYAHEWSFAGAAGVESGQLRVVASTLRTGALSQFSTHLLRLSVDGGSSWTDVTEVPDFGGAQATILMPVVTADRNDIRLRSNTWCNLGGTITGRVYNIFWETINTATPFSQIESGLLTVLNETARRDWPGHYGNAAQSLAEGQQYVTSFEAKALDTTPTTTLLVTLHQKESDTYYTLGGVQAASILTTWRRFAMRWTAPAGVTDGAFEITISTGSTEAIVIDRLMIESGDKIHAYQFHIDETGKALSYPNGIPGDYDTVGAWTSDAQVRIAEVT